MPVSQPNHLKPGADLEEELGVDSTEACTCVSEEDTASSRGETMDQSLLGLGQWIGAPHSLVRKSHHQWLIMALG
jgi:hypothetical protein